MSIQTRGATPKEKEIKIITNYGTNYIARNRQGEIEEIFVHLLTAKEYCRNMGYTLEVVKG